MCNKIVLIFGAPLETPLSTPRNAGKFVSIYTADGLHLGVSKKRQRGPPNLCVPVAVYILCFSYIYMSRRSGKDPIDEEEQQRLRNEEEARRIEALRKEKEQEPIPQSVLQYASSPLITVPWSPFGFGGDP